ncbi:DUF721 domain-containing protein (plasmid) [Streptomyces sp. NBC_01525]|uniref:DUF721 domain-containing protein n=1 Tax=Streptomyces sp. NBC_01525 TaxID=2903893 RepID=UPI002F90BB53
MSDPHTASGADLARQALATWRATAATRPSTKPRVRRRTRRDGRDPVGLNAVLAQLTTEQDWKASVDGGSLLDQWPELCPDLEGKVAPVHFDAATGRLDLRPASPAFATHLRLLGPQLVARLQTKGAPVRTIRLLQPGPLPGAIPVGAATPRPAQPEAAVRIRAGTSTGYEVALAAHRAHKPDRTATDLQQRVQAAAERQVNALRVHRESDEAQPEAAWATEADRRGRAERDRTVRRLAHAQKADRAAPVPAAFHRLA